MSSGRVVFSGSASCSSFSCLRRAFSPKRAPMHKKATRMAIRSTVLRITARVTLRWPADESDELEADVLLSKGTHAPDSWHDTGTRPLGSSGTTPCDGSLERYDAVIGRQRQCLADGAAEVGRSELEALRVLERALDRGERAVEAFARQCHHGR